MAMLGRRWSGKNNFYYQPMSLPIRKCKEVIRGRVKEKFGKQICRQIDNQCTKVFKSKGKTEKKRKKKGHRWITKFWGTFADDQSWHQVQKSLPSTDSHILPCPILSTTSKKAIGWERKTKIVIIPAHTIITTINTNFCFWIVPLTRFLTKGFIGDCWGGCWSSKEGVVFWSGNLRVG